MNKSPRSIRAKVLESDLKVSEFELYLVICAHFQTLESCGSICPPPSNRLKSTTTVFFQEDGFGVR